MSLTVGLCGLECLAHAHDKENDDVGKKDASSKGNDSWLWELFIPACRKECGEELSQESIISLFSLFWMSEWKESLRSLWKREGKWWSRVLKILPSMLAHEPVPFSLLGSWYGQQKEDRTGSRDNSLPPSLFYFFDPTLSFDGPQIKRKKNWPSR